MTKGRYGKFGPGVGKQDSSQSGLLSYDKGYQDGLEKGRDDGRDRKSFDPVRQSRYRSADHGYNSRYGSKDAYKQVYRDGFEQGYREGYDQYRGGSRNGGGVRLPWPF